MGEAPKREAAAAAARFLNSLASLVTATPAPSEAAATLGGFAAEVDVVVATRNQRLGVDLHAGESERFTFPGLDMLWMKRGTPREKCGSNGEGNKYSLPHSSPHNAMTLPARSRIHW